MRGTHSSAPPEPQPQRKEFPNKKRLFS